MTGRADRHFDELVRDLATRVDAWAPGWTDQHEGDPGITLAELFAFLGESLLYRGDVSPRTRSRVADVLRRLESAGPEPCDEPPLRRTHYASGRLLGVAEFQAEQDYVRARQRRHNRLLHGVGIVSGLAVSVEPRGGRPAVSVSPGVAIGPDGEELVLCEPVSVRAAVGGVSLVVTLGLTDHPVDPQPDGEETWIEERAEVAIAPEAAADRLALARLERAGGTWRLDPTFAPRRLR